LADTSIDVTITAGSRLAALHGSTAARERTTCNYGLDPAFSHIAGEHGLTISAVDGTGEVRAVERADHPFFVGTLYQPQLTSSPAAPHPIWVGFAAAVARRRS
jgi:CTP synthase (UTP-ammonia lyase)